MTLIYSPVSMKELLYLSPRNYPELFDEHGNVNLEGYFHTPKGQEFFSLAPFHAWLPGKFNKKKDVINDMFWSILYLSLTYNKDYYIYLVNDKWYYDNFGGFGHGNSNGTIQGKDCPEPVNKKWEIAEEDYNLNNDIKLFVKLCNMRRKTFYEFKIEGVSEGVD